MTSPAVSVSNLNVKSSDGTFILKDINFEINSGDCVVITGPNGAGKTTLLKTLNGLTEISEGTIKIFAQQINRQTKSQTGYIPQINFYDKNMPVSVREILEIGLSAKYGIFKKFDNNEIKLIEEAAKNTGILHLLNKPAGKLSGGETQKMSIARVLLQDAKLIMMDEPMSNLDAKSQKDISEITDFICTQRNVTVLMVIHNISQIPKSCNKILIMENGQIVKFGDKKEIFNFDFFKNLYGL